MKRHLGIILLALGTLLATFPQFTPEIPPPVVRSSSIWVFELP